MDKLEKKRIRADLMLLLVTLFWGTSYLLIDYSLEELSPFNINILRFFIAFLTIFLFFRKQLIPVSRTTLKYGAVIGLMVMITYLSSTLGVKYTSLSNAGFLCALTVVFTPVLGYFFKKQKAGIKLIVAVAFAVAGIGFMTLNGGASSAFGDFMSVMCAVSYAVVLLITESAVCKAEVNPFQLGVYQIGFAGIFQLAVALPVESLHLPQSPKVWISIVVLSFFCTGLAFVVQSVALQHTTASRAGIIFSLEPVFAAIIAFTIAGEKLSPQGYFGAALLMISLLTMELDLSFFKCKSLPKNTDA